MHDATNTPDPWSGHPVIDRAEQGLRAFGDLNQAQAANLLPLWRHCAELSTREVAAVLARFEPGGER